MTFPMPVLIDVLSARYTSTGAVDYELVVTNHCGNPEPETIPYTRDVNEEWLPDGRFYELGVDIDAWMFAHPEFDVADYEPPTPSTNPGDYLLSMRKLRLGLVRNGFPVDFIPIIISTIPDALQRAEAQIWYEETTEGVLWGHPMTQALLAAAAQAYPNLTLEFAAQMWIEAAAYDAPQVP